MEEYKFKLNDEVEFKKSECHGRGRIKGCNKNLNFYKAGCLYVVEIIDYFTNRAIYDDYPFTHLICFESELTLKT